MFLFPWLYHGYHISDFEKIDIFGLTANFGVCVQGLGRAILRFLHGRPQHGGLKNFKKWWEHRKFFQNLVKKGLSYPQMVLGVVGTIWSLRNPILKFFSSKMTLLSDYPPLLTYLRDIGQFVENRRFGQNGDFGDFQKLLNFHNMADYSWECVQKWYLGKEIPSLQSLDTFTCLE